MADMVVEIRMKRISEVEEKYRKESDAVIRNSRVTSSPKGRSLSVSTSTFGDDSFYSDEEVVEILEDPDMSDIYHSFSADDELEEALEGA
jgi:hypothetical protein